MINDYFKENWLKILNFNSNVSLVENPRELKELVRIPITPIEIDAFLLYHLFSLLYPRFVNDQQNILDIIVSDFELENVVFGLYLYETTEPGIHSAIKELPKDSIKVKQEDLEDREKLFNKLQSFILKEHGIKISCMRLIRKRGVDLINSHCDKLAKSTIYEFIVSLLDMIQISLETNLFSIYPEPNFLRFFKNCITLLNGLRLSNVFAFFESLLPSFSTLIIMNSTRLPIALKIRKDNNKHLPEMYIKLKLLDGEKYNLNRKTHIPDFKLIQSDFNVDKIVNIEQNPFLLFLSELFETEMPPNREKLKLLFQKALYGIRSYDLNWRMFPRPKINNTLLRFLIRLLGINLNLKKLSHWAIPDFLFDLCATYIGLNANLLIILTEQRNKTPNSNNLMIVRIENGAINKLEHITDKNFLSKVNQESLESIRLSVSEKFGFITTIFRIDKFLIKAVSRAFLINFHKTSLFSILKVVKLLKKPQYFQVFPEIPPYALIKNRRSFSLLKDVLSIAIDKHEF